MVETMLDAWDKMVSKKADYHSSEDHTLAGNADIHQTIMETDADYKRVKVYKVYMVLRTHLVEEFSPVREGFPKGMTTEPQLGKREGRK